MGNQQAKPSTLLTNNNSTKEDEMTRKNGNNDDSEKKMPNDSIHMNISSLSSKEGGGGCPMKKKDSSANTGWFSGRRGNNSSSTSSINQKMQESLSTQEGNEQGGGGGCPVKHNNCKQVEYNVYSQPIDPKNNMPTVANQLPSPLQNEKLSTTRVQSTIPKGSTSSEEGDSSSSSTSTWTYPSPQMFYNSLSRKNKLGDTTESDIESVVALHNNMNEKTWAKVIQWEETLLGTEIGNESKLLKFMGRPSDLSPKARMKNILFGHPLPFDRHDWTIIRKDGTEVRYVIDYYYDESRAKESEESALPKMDDFDAVQSILVDVRPAVDSVSSTIGRVFTMPLATYLHQSTKFEALPLLPTNEMKRQLKESQTVWSNIQKNVEESKLKSRSSGEKSMILKQEDIPEEQREDKMPEMTDDEAKEIALSFASMVGQCKSLQKVVDKCKDEAECAKASLALTMCLAKVVCPLQENAVAEALNDESVDMNDEKAVGIYNETFDKALENMAICVSAKSEKAAIAKQRYPELFKDI